MVDCEEETHRNIISSDRTSFEVARGQLGSPTFRGWCRSTSFPMESTFAWRAASTLYMPFLEDSMSCCFFGKQAQSPFHRLKPLRHTLEELDTSCFSIQEHSTGCNNSSRPACTQGFRRSQTAVLTKARRGGRYQIFHPVEEFCKKSWRSVGLPNFSRVVSILSFQGVLGRAVAFVEDAEDAGEGKLLPGL